MRRARCVALHCNRPCTRLLPPGPPCREALARWHAYFLFKLAEHALTHKGHEAAADRKGGV